MQYVLLVLVVFVLVILSRSIKIVPQQQVKIIERLGKFHARAEAGLNIILPFVDSVRDTIDREPRMAVTMSSIEVNALPRAPANSMLCSAHAAALGPDCRSTGVPMASGCFSTSMLRQAQLLRTRNSSSDMAKQKSAFGSIQTSRLAPTSSVLHAAPKT